MIWYFLYNPLYFQTHLKTALTAKLETRNRKAEAMLPACLICVFSQLLNQCMRWVHSYVPLIRKEINFCKSERLMFSNFYFYLILVYFRSLCLGGCVAIYIYFILIQNINVKFWQNSQVSGDKPPKTYIILWHCNHTKMIKVVCYVFFNFVVVVCLFGVFFCPFFSVLLVNFHWSLFEWSLISGSTKRKSKYIIAYPFGTCYKLSNVKYTSLKWLRQRLRLRCYWDALLSYTSFQSANIWH